MGSIAMDTAGSMALGYSVSSASVFTGIRYVGRESNDTLGTMPSGEHTIINGTGYSSSYRWGDYSSMNVDPSDGCTFRFTTMYANASHNWATQIAAFAFDSCLAPASSYKQVFVTQSGDFGSSWSAPVQLTDATDEEYHPRVAASINDDTVLIAFNRDYESAGDTDVNYVFSEDGGSTWSGEHFLPWTYDDEESVDLAVSNEQGRFHAVYWHEYDIWYTSTLVTNPSGWSP